MSHTCHDKENILKCDSQIFISAWNSGYIKLERESELSSFVLGCMMFSAVAIDILNFLLSKGIGNLEIPYVVKDEFKCLCLSIKNLPYFARSRVDTMLDDKRLTGVAYVLENFDKFFVIPIVGACEFALYGALVWILDIFFNFLPTV